MEMSLSSKARGQYGFSLIEMMVAIAVLSVGLMSMAALMARMISTTSRSGYMSIAMQLASEKLEDLNRYPYNDPNVVVPTGTTAGSLTSDSINPVVTSDGETTSVNYYDEVRFSGASGTVTQIRSRVSGGSTVYDTIAHQPDGSIVTQSNLASLPSGTGSMRFRRRWVIERDQPTVGVRRVTVQVTMLYPTITPVNAQMSMVRP